MATAFLIADFNAFSEYAKTKEFGISENYCFKWEQDLNLRLLGHGSNELITGWELVTEL